MTPDLNAIIEKLEKAEEGSVELDLEIARWRGVTVMLHDEIAGKNVESTYWQYTRSMDHAMSLIPPGFTLAFQRFPADEMFNSEGAQAALHDRTGKYFQHECRTGALAITTAALKALAA